MKNILKNARLLHEPSRKDKRLPGRKDAKCQSGLVERFEDLQQHRRAVESAEGWWNMSTVSSALAADIGRGVMQLWTESEDGKRRR